MRPLLAAAFVLAALGSAHADDEGSEHTAQLVGKQQDTLGVLVKFDDKTGWEMTVRPRPGADAHTYRIALPAWHAHYIAYVAPGRTAITFVETSAGATKQRAGISPRDTLAWVFGPDGKLVRSWTYGSVLTERELGTARHSISHTSWAADARLTAKGVELPLHAGKRTVVLAVDGQAMR